MNIQPDSDPNSNVRESVSVSGGKYTILWGISETGESLRRFDKLSDRRFGDSRLSDRKLGDRRICHTDRSLSLSK